jgi:hypothetical protein
MFDPALYASVANCLCSPDALTVARQLLYTNVAGITLRVCEVQLGEISAVLVRESTPVTIFTKESIDCYQ